MNSTSLHNNIQQPEIGLVSEATFLIINDVFCGIVFVLSSIGVITNIINIKTFISMRLEDGITVSFFGLAISDLGFSVFVFIYSSASIVASFEMRYKLTNLLVQPKFVVGMFSGNMSLMFYQMTCFTTTFIAVARCMCVLWPFQFKNFFTRSRSIFALVLFVLVAIALSLPVMVTLGTQRKFDPRVNKTRVVLWVSPVRSAIKDVVMFAFLNVWLSISSFVVIVCVVVIAECLRKSIKFRKSSSLGTAESKAVENVDDSKLAGKELQVVKQVIIISSIYTLSSIPGMLLSISRFTMDDFDVGKQFSKLYFLMSELLVIFQLLNSASSFPVYYVFNSKFRSLCFPLVTNSK